MWHLDITLCIRAVEKKREEIGTKEKGCERGCVPSGKGWCSVVEQDRRLRYWSVLGRGGELHCWTLAALQGD